MSAQYPTAADLDAIDHTKERVYLTVRVEFDGVGYMYPTSVVWENKTEYPIDEVMDSRQVEGRYGVPRWDRYKVKIKGQTRFLFFEHISKNNDSVIGRWFVDVPRRQTVI